MQLASVSELEQLFVRHRAPQEIGQATGQGKVVDLGADSRRNKKSGETNTPFSPTRIAASKLAPCSSFFFTRP